jgi:hypothetical protein
MSTRPPFPKQPIDPSDTRSVSMWQRQFYEPLYRILGRVAGVTWDMVSKAGSKLSDLSERPHSQLQTIEGWTSGADSTQNKHISQADGKVWQDHVGITDANPHGTNHGQLDAIAVLDPTSADAVQDRHLSDAQGKVWQDHTLDADIHHTLEEIQDDIVGMLTEGNAVTLTYDDVANTLTLAVVQAAASADVTTANAGVIYTAAEQGLINDLKTSLNDLKGKLRASGILEA